MVDFVWDTRSPLQKALKPGRFGADLAEPGVVLTELTNFSLVQVLARRGRWADTAKAAKKIWKVPAPERPGAAFGKAATLVWSGPDQFFAVMAGSDMPGPLAALGEAFAGVASLSDQSGGRCCIRISGMRARDVLAKISSLDLHDRAFPVGAAAATSIDHTSVSLWRSADAPGGEPVFNLLVFTSFADSLWRTMIDMAAEYGIEAARGDYR